jgi:hypothetical protein
MWGWTGNGSLSCPSDPLNHPKKPRCSYRRSGLGHEHIRARPLQWPKGSKLGAL